jgi:hypothetical protein
LFTSVITGLLLSLIPFAILSYIQNMAFTWSSRSRQSNDPNYHRKASWASNGIYYITNALLTFYIVKTQLWWMLLFQGVVYTLTTAEGSVHMMKVLLKKETGKRKVGNQFTEEQVEILRTRSLFVDTGDGLGTFTTDEIVRLKELIGSKVEEETIRVSEPLVGDTDARAVASGSYSVEGYGFKSVNESPAWQPAKIDAVPAAQPGQGSKL